LYEKFGIVVCHGVVLFSFVVAHSIKDTCLRNILQMFLFYKKTKKIDKFNRYMI